MSFLKRESGSPKFKDKEEDLPKNMWMVRSCHLYDDEYDDCTSIRGRFQQYFVHGSFEDCAQWQHDYLNCVRWKHTRNKEALNQVLASEEERRKKRLNPHYNNPVWEDRAEPPPDWDAPLPPFLAEKLKGTYLEIKSKEMKEGKVLTSDRLCTIM